MACGEYGPGRMAEPDEIVDAIVAQLGTRALSRQACSCHVGANA